MSNRQLGWDNQRIRGDLSPREIDDQDKEQLEEQESRREPENNADKVLDSNPGTHSKKGH